MIYKSYILEQNFQKLNDHKIFLFYGENVGLKDEFKQAIKKNNNCEIINLFQDEIIKNNNLLSIEILNKSLFEENKIILIQNANDKIFEIIEEVEKNISEEKIFIFSDILDKRSKLRNFFEKSKTYGIVPCYQDNEITIKKIISDKLRDFKGLTPHVINLIAINTGLNRNKLNNELEKIKSCFFDKNIDTNKIDLLLNIKTNDDFTRLKDVALSGNKMKTNMLLTDTIFETEDNIYYLNTINQRINKLKQIENLKINNTNLEALISELKPPIFWKDKPIILEQSKKWSKEKIRAALNKTFNAEIEIKSNSSIKKELIIKNLIIDLCLLANVS